MSDPVAEEQGNTVGSDQTEGDNANYWEDRWSEPTREERGEE